MRCSFAVAAVVLAVLVVHPVRAEQALVLTANLQVLRCEPPGTDIRFAGSSAPGQIFLPDERVRIRARRGSEAGIVEIDDLPIPPRFGTYALVLIRGGERRFLGTVARVPAPRADATLETTPIFGEFSFFDREEAYAARAAVYERIGVRGMRLETSWSERQDGTYDWSRLDRMRPRRTRSS